MAEKRKAPKEVNFRCNGEKCTFEQGELFMPSEEIPYRLSTFCPMCGGLMNKLDVKTSSQRTFINDPRT